jgi:hypothetical protein
MTRMQNGKWILALSVLFFLAGCEKAKDFHYYVKNNTDQDLTVFVDYSISAKGHREADTLTISPVQKKKVLTHSGLGGFYTGAIEKIRFTGTDTLRQEWRNRDRAEISKHFFRRQSWEIIHRDDDEEHYRFIVSPEDLKRGDNG